jgi:hypothetical protein
MAERAGPAFPSCISIFLDVSGEVILAALNPTKILVVYSIAPTGRARSRFIKALATWMMEGRKMTREKETGVLYRWVPSWPISTCCKDGKSDHKPGDFAVKEVRERRGTRRERVDSEHLRANLATRKDHTVQMLAQGFTNWAYPRYSCAWMAVVGATHGWRIAIETAITPRMPLGYFCGPIRRNKATEKANNPNFFRPTLA